MNRPTRPKRLWWYPTGLFAFLPIHAAGVYDSSGESVASGCVSDYVVSSYTPSLTALLDYPPHDYTKQLKITTVVQPNALPGTVDELWEILEHVPNESITVLGVPGSPAHPAAVLSRLSDSSIVHFACHGSQDLQDPLDSAFILDNGECMTVSLIMRQCIQEGSLAYLSACETATGDQNVPDEAMHLAASLLFSGFRSVVGTMW